MSYSKQTLSAKEALLHPKRLVSRLRTTRISHDDGEETERLVVEECSAAQPLLPTLPQLEIETPSTSDSGLDEETLLHQCALIAREILSSLPHPTRLLGTDDIKFTTGHPVAAGGFTNILEATHDGRRVIVKEYRCYMSFDLAQVATVRCGRLCRANC
jgi:hypothetical protein